MLHTSSKPTIRYSDQLFLGIALGVGSMFAIMAKSWATFGVYELFSLFLFLPSLALRSIARGGYWRLTGACLAACFLATLLWAIASFAERMLFLHGNSYPAWLATRDVGELAPKYPYMPESALNALCPNHAHGPLMIFAKNDGIIAFRCDFGGFWPFTNTYIGHTKENHEH